MTMNVTKAAYEPCPKAIGGHDIDRYGRCAWCGARIGPPVPRPDRFDGPSELTDAYGIYYDPDYEV
jgi:hypothetical protein